MFYRGECSCQEMPQRRYIPSTLSCESDSYANLGLNINDLLIAILGTPPVVFGDLIVSLNILEENSRSLHMESTQYGL